MDAMRSQSERDSVVIYPHRGATWPAFHSAHLNEQ